MQQSVCYFDRRGFGTSPGFTCIIVSSFDNSYQHLSINTDITCTFVHFKKIRFFKKDKWKQNIIKIVRIYDAFKRGQNAIFSQTTSLSHGHNMLRKLYLDIQVFILNSALLELAFNFSFNHSQMHDCWNLLLC